MAIFGAVIILKLGLDQDSFVTDLLSNGSKKGYQGSLLLVGEVGRWLSVLDDVVGVSGITKDVINIRAEVWVVNKTIWKLILVNKGLNFLLGKFDVKSA